MKRYAVIFVLCLFATPVFAFGRCDILGDHAVMFAQWRNAGLPESKVTAYFEGQTDGSLVRQEKALAEGIYNHPRGYASPAKWQRLVLRMCHEQYGY